jgi:hypothetical protein
MPENPAHGLGLERPDRWPFFRPHPTRVVLDVRPGHEAKELPPVRIFLGTEEAQYRAERIFFYSIEQVRDPGRVYEIYLMKNVVGFDRSKWRTGFTNYRYAIPEWAGGKGRAIYNDVDQIYLADPALLFDLEMGNHGYLAISAKDTSVMLIDCGRMVDLWNIETASTLGKHALIDKPSSTPGLWGELDGHWNARDQEYVEGRTRCLHYTALHQQPWHPFPEAYSYHPNPLAYVWYDLERAADEEGYEVFTSEAPSPDFAAAVTAVRGAVETPPAPGGLARSLVQDLAVADVLQVRLPGDLPVATLEGEIPTTTLTLAPAMAWPEAAADAAVASNVLPHLPPADLPWLLHRLFAIARKLVHVDAVGIARQGMGSADWWRKRLAEIGERHPGKSWSLTVADRAAAIPGTVRHYTERSRPKPTPGTAWTLIDGKPAQDAQVRALAEALGFRCSEKQLETGLFGAVTAPSGSLEGPYPDVVIAAGADAAAVAREVKKRSRGATRAVVIGAPGARFDSVDLVVANPAERLPVRPNTVQIAAPLVQANGRDASTGRLDLLVLGAAQRPFRRTKEDLARLGRSLKDEAKGPLAVHVSAGVSQEEQRALAKAVGEIEVLEGSLDDAMSKAARLYTTGEDALTLTRLCASGKPVMLLPLDYWYDAIPGSGPVLSALTLLIGGGTSYRGTPHQQHVLGRLIDRLIAAGWLRLPTDPGRLHGALVARGLLQPLGKTERMATPHPLDDTARVVEAIEHCLTKEPAATI